MPWTQIRLVRADGRTYTQSVFAPDHTTASIDAQAGAYWQQTGATYRIQVGGVWYVYCFCQDFRWRLMNELDVGDTAVEDDLGLKRLHIVVTGTQSNGGRGLSTDIPAAAQTLLDATDDVVWPPYWPVLTYGEGPGLTQIVGASRFLAARIVQASSVYDRVTIHGMYQGNTQILQHWDVSTGTGLYIDKRDDEKILNGASTDNPPGMIKASDDWMLLMNIGEADAANFTPRATYVSRMQDLVTKVRADMGGQYLGAILGGLTPTNKTTAGTQLSWQDIVDGQDDLDDRVSAEPFATIPYLESEMRLDDPLHASSPGHYAWSERAFNFCAGHATMAARMGL